MDAWRCAYCGETKRFGLDAARASDLVLHLAVDHGWDPTSSIVVRTCRLCNTRFDNRTELGRHLRYACEAYELLAAEQALRGTTLPPWKPPPRKPRLKKPPKSRAVKRLESTQKLLATWERKLKLATTKVKKYRTLLKRRQRFVEKEKENERRQATEE